MNAFAGSASTRPSYTPVLNVARGQKVEFTCSSPSIDVPVHFAGSSFICGDRQLCALCRAGIGSRMNRYVLGFVASKLYLACFGATEGSAGFEAFDVLEIVRNRSTNHLKVQRLLVAADSFDVHTSRDVTKAVVRLHKLPVIEEMWSGSDAALEASLKKMALRAAEGAARKATGGLL